VGQLSHRVIGSSGHRVIGSSGHRVIKNTESSIHQACQCQPASRRLTQARSPSGSSSTFLPGLPLRSL
jgi:hypothetical protein